MREFSRTFYALSPLLAPSLFIETPRAGSKARPIRYPYLRILTHTDSISAISCQIYVLLSICYCYYYYVTALQSLHTQIRNLCCVTSFQGYNRDFLASQAGS